MTGGADQRPIACSLEKRELERRLDEIAALAAESLLSHEFDQGRHRLRFRPGRGTRRRLEALVAAEAECCPFLELSLEPGTEETVLIVLAPAQWAPA